MQPAPIQTNHNLAMQVKRARKQGIAGVFIGLALFVIGVVITAATYAHASGEGGTYVVAWGPIVFGPIVAVRGFIALLRLRKPKLTVRPAT